jgi:hypothetical protein
MKIHLRDGLPFVTVTLTQQGQSLTLQHVLLDTGSAGSLFSADELLKINVRLELNDQLRRIRGVGGTEFVFVKFIDSLVVGKLRVDHLPVEVGALDYGHCHTVRTVWIPDAAVEFVAPTPIPGVELSMATLAELAAAPAAHTALSTFVTTYRAWINRQRAELPTLPAPHATIGAELLDRATQAADRLAAGIQALADPRVLHVFRLTNRAMARAARQRWPHDAPRSGARSN